MSYHACICKLEQKTRSLFVQALNFKGSSEQSHFIFEINVGKSRTRHTTTVKFNDEFPERFKID